MAPTRSAYDITDPMIRETGEAIQSGDFDKYMRHFALPFVLETFEAKHLIGSRREMQEHFDGVRAFRAEQRIAYSTRENISAVFQDPKTITLIHVSHLFHTDGTRFDRPYPTYSVIRENDGHWLTHHCRYGVGDLEAFTRALMKYKEDKPGPHPPVQTP